jgi:hypothetical protein
MATKKLTVPQNGTQPATIPSPIDNMISTSCPKNITNRRPTSFNINQELMLKFKTVCVQQGRPMSSVVEELISKFVDSVC